MATDGTNNGAGGPPSEVREHLHKAVRIAEHASSVGDIRGAWEACVCAARLVVGGCADAEAACTRLRAALEELATEADVEEQVAALRKAFTEVAGPLDPGPPPGGSDPLAEMRAWISHAISLGAPAYNEGDQRGCYEVYAATARLLLGTVPGADEARQRLEGALRSCAPMTDVNEQAWAMRHAFDAILAPPSTEGTDEMRTLIAQAIQIGAPAYNAGDHRGCYEVYAATARLIVKTFEGGEEAKKRLQQALQRCRELDDPDKKAWVMRRAFDSILTGGQEEEDVV